MKIIDWEQILLGDENWVFMLEVAFRTLIMYIVILAGLRLLGKRGVRQLSVFELVVIISLGSAAGDPMFYREVGLLVPVIVFLVIVASYRITTYLMAKSEKFDDLIEGTSTYFIEEGEFNIAEFRKEDLAKDEFFAELRQLGVSHLGQIETALLETSGSLSVYFYPDEKVKAGLPILPRLFEKTLINITSPGIYACRFCGNTEKIQATEIHHCEKCTKTGWVKAIDEKRVR